MGYVYSRESVKQFAKGAEHTWAKNLGMSVASMAVMSTVNMIVNQIADSITNGDFERAFIKFKNNNAFKRMIENAKERKQLKIESTVTPDNIEAGMTIRNVVADSEFLVEEVLERSPNSVKIKYTLTNPEELGIDRDSISKSAEVELTDKALKSFTKVL